MSTLAIVGPKRSECSLTETHRLFEHRIEHRREIAGGGVDNPQHLGGRSLLLQRFARRGYEARVLHRDDRLSGEVLQQGDLFIGEWSDFLANGDDLPKEYVVLA